MAPSSVRVSPEVCSVTCATSASLDSCSVESAENTSDLRSCSGSIGTRASSHTSTRAEVALVPYAAEVVQGKHPRRSLLLSVWSAHLRPGKERTALGSGRGQGPAGPRVPELSNELARVDRDTRSLFQLRKLTAEHHPWTNDLPPVWEHR